MILSHSVRLCRETANAQQLGRRKWTKYWFWTSLIATIALGILFFVAYFALMFGAIGLLGAGGS